MLSYCLKCRKNTESKNPKVVKTKKAEEQCIYQNDQCAIVKKNWNLLKSKIQIPLLGPLLFLKV